MSVQKNARLEIRLPESLKNDVQRFCDDQNIDLTFYVTTLIRVNLKKSGYLSPVKKVVHQWTGDVDDMPTDIRNSEKRWLRIA